MSFRVVRGKLDFFADSFFSDLDHVVVVKEVVEDAVEAGTSPMSLPPLFQRAVGGHHRRLHLVAEHDDLEEIFPRFGRQLLDAHVVDDQQVALEVARRDLVLALGQVVFEQLGAACATHMMENGADV